jgi:hypothetical protein
MAQDAATRMKPRVFRSMPLFVLGWAWIVLAAALLVDVAARGRDADSAIAAGALLLGSGIAYVICLRPRVVADDEGVRLHNPLRDVRVPWSAVDKIEATDAIVLHSGDRAYRAWALQSSPRARLRAEARARRAKGTVPDHAAEYAEGRMPADFAADQLNELARAHSHNGGGTASVAVSWLAIAAVAVPAAILAVSILIAVA